MKELPEITTFNELLGKTIEEIKVKDKNEDNKILIKLTNGKYYKFYHEQDCCESVSIESITGDLEDLLNNPLLEAEEVTDSQDDDCGSTTYTFYKFSTIKGSVTVRWIGSSNGYYSESVYFTEIDSIEFDEIKTVEFINEVEYDYKEYNSLDSCRFFKGEKYDVYTYINADNPIVRLLSKKGPDRYISKELLLQNAILSK